jgi:hypothetical protein
VRPGLSRWSGMRQPVSKRTGDLPRQFRAFWLAIDPERGVGSKTCVTTIAGRNARFSWAPFKGEGRAGRLDGRQSGRACRPRPASARPDPFFTGSMFAQSSSATLCLDGRPLTLRRAHQTKASARSRGTKVRNYPYSAANRALTRLGLLALLGVSIAGCATDSQNLRNARAANLASETALNAQIMSDRARDQRCERNPGRRECSRSDRYRAESCERDPSRRECYRRD